MQLFNLQKGSCRCTNGRYHPAYTFDRFVFCAPAKYFATTGYTTYDNVLLADFDSSTATLNFLHKKMELDIEVQGHDAFIRSQIIMHIIIETERRS